MQTSGFHPPQRILLGPGPSNIDARVAQAMLAPLLGHLDPVYLKLLDEIQDLLRAVFETRNRVTLSMAGTGGAGMESCVANLVEEGEEVVVCVSGFFGQRLADFFARWGGKVLRRVRRVRNSQVFLPAVYRAVLAAFRLGA